MVAHLPTNTLPQKRGGLPAQTPSLCEERSANLSLRRHPDLPGSAGQQQGAGGRGPRPCQGSPETPRPFHCKPVGFNPLLETMQILIQKNTSAVRVFVPIRFPGLLIAATPSGPSWDTPQAGLASPPAAPVRVARTWVGPSRMPLFLNFRT